VADPHTKDLCCIFFDPQRESEPEFERGNTMRNSVIFRTTMWAGSGAIAAVGWGIYFATADKTIPTDPIVYNLARLTEPIVALGLYFFDFPLGLRLTIAANAATYALVGLIVEKIQQHYRPLNTSN